MILLNNNIESNNTIFIQIAAYRDPQLVPTLKDALINSKYPDNLKFCIAWQHNPEDDWDNLDIFKTDPRFQILDINYKDSKGACWARNLIQQHYNGEKYTLQLDSHHRFEKNWDDILIKMLEGLKNKGIKKPLLTAYIPSFDPDNEPEGRIYEPWQMNFDRFIPEGAVFFIPAIIPNWQLLLEPVNSRFYSAHFCFTDGVFCLEVPHDPSYYFHGEEISIAARAYTWGYDLFHPHRPIIWHEYTRKGRTKQWDDDKLWGQRNEECHKRNRQLFGMDGEERVDLGIYGFGTERTLEDYEKWSGLNFKIRGVQQWVLDNNLPPNPQVYETDEEYKESFLTIFKHCIDVAYDRVPLNDYTFWCVSFEMNDGRVIYRQDANPDEILRMKNDPDGYCKVWRQFHSEIKPDKWIVWPYSRSQGWCQRLEGKI